MSNTRSPGNVEQLPEGHTPTRPKRPALRYYGAKFRIRDWILSFFPEHHCYVEPYSGAGSILLAKPRTPVEVYNDLDGDVVNFFRVLRDKAQSEQLIDRLRLTPYSRREFIDSYIPTLDPVESAARTVVRAFMGRGGSVCKPKHSSFAINVTGHSKASSFARYPDSLTQIIERLQGVFIEEQDALTVMRRFSSPQTLIYCDPPYVHSTRTNRDEYAIEMDDAAHRELAAVLHSLDSMVILSGYDSPLYDELYAGWQRETKQVRADGGHLRTEVLWLNPLATQNRRVKEILSVTT